MKRILTIVVLISIIVIGCKTKRTLKNKSEQIDNVEVSETKKESEKTQTEASKKEEIKTDKKEEKKEEKKEVRIFGIVNKENPLNYYNVVDGDTIDFLRVTGIANVEYLTTNTNEKSHINNNSTTNTYDIKKDEKTTSGETGFTGNIIKKVKTKSEDIVKKDFQFGAYITFFVWGIVIIAILCVILWARKSDFWNEIWEKINKMI